MHLTIVYLKYIYKHLHVYTTTILYGCRFRISVRINNCVPKKHQINFVYVTPTNNFSNVKRWQSFDTGSEGTKVLGKLPSDAIRVLSRMVQFCMRFKKY